MSENESVLFELQRLTAQSRSLILKTLGTPSDSQADPNHLAVRIEEEIFEANKKSTDNVYRSSVRTHVLNLKEFLYLMFSYAYQDEKTMLRKDLLNGELSPQEFARMSGKVSHLKGV